MPASPGQDAGGGRALGEGEAWCPVFPLGVKKDVSRSPGPTGRRRASSPPSSGRWSAAPRSERAALLPGLPRDALGTRHRAQAGRRRRRRRADRGDAVARAAINEGFDATHIPSYGPESRGGTSYADVRLAESEVLSPACPAPHVLVAFNAPSLAKFGPGGRRAATVVYDSSVVAERAGGSRSRASAVVGVPCSRDRPGPGARGGEEHRGPGRAAGGHPALPRRDLPDRDPPGAQGQVRPWSR